VLAESRESGGYVFVESEPGEGSTFRVYLPRAATPAAGSHAVIAATGTATRVGSETILLVEDDDAVRLMARRVLDRSGYRVLEATTGAEALRLCEESGDAIDLILSDLVMPEMGGRELAEQVRARHPGVRLLFMSGYTEDAAMRRSFLDSSDSFLAKPFTPTALVAKVREVLDGPSAAVAPAAAYARPSPERARQG
jgi:two-component system, cell cycle sensor histidine kinase and response regulator CckA